MLFQTAGIEVSPWIPPVVAFTISFFTSMGGISGAFLLLPFQISFLGYTNPSVSATNQLFNIVAIPSGVYRYCREGRMVWPLTWVVVAGTLPGVFIGAVVRVEFLPDPRAFKLFAAGVLLYIGVKMIRDLRKRTAGVPKNIAAEERFRERVSQHQKETAGRDQSGNNTLPAVRVTHFDLKRLSYTFDGEASEISIWKVFALSAIVGVVGGIYGIGGGSIIAPFLITFFRLPIYTVAGAALMGTFVTSVAGVLFYQIIAPFYPDMSVAPDYLLGGLFGLGGAAGMYFGACCQKHVPARAIKWMLAGIILFTVLKYVAAFFGY